MWAIGVLQPASIRDALGLIAEILPNVAPLPKIKELEPTISRWREQGYIARVHEKSRLYSLTAAGNHSMPMRLRRQRDKSRLFLLKTARAVSVFKSGKVQQKLAGVSPAVNSSSGIQEGARPISSADVPRSPRDIGRAYWPRVVKQLNSKVGSEPHSPDTYLDYYSYPTVQAIHNVSDDPASSNDLSITDLGIALGISPRLLTSFIHKPAHHYRTFEIGKRGGGSRVINSPKVFLKVVQYWILDYFLFRLRVHSSCHSYQNKRSILTNAELHVGRRFVANIDIEDYFGSIDRKKVSALLRENGFGERVANAFSRLATLNNALPQGAPTSPVISNSYLYEFDEAITKLALDYGLSYTRYADDITISGDSREHVSIAIQQAAALLTSRGLNLNDTKSRIASQGGQQRVTGVVVNVKAQPPRGLRRRVRAMFHQAELYPRKFKNRVAELRGYLSYLYSYPELRNSAEIKKYNAVLEKLIR